MMRDLFLSRVSLRQDAPIAALRSVFLPESEERRKLVGHQLIWTLFADSPDRERDFLWRESGDGRFYILSQRPPVDRHDVFHIDPPKPFAPNLKEGDRLRFSLRANATVAKRIGEHTRGKPVDVVMDALFKMPKGVERAAARSRAVQKAGLEWLARQAMKGGFDIGGDGGDCTAQVAAYRPMRLDHKRNGMTIGVLDYEGELTVTQPDVFLIAVGTGLGRAKAFGCGMMLIRRA